MDDLIRNMTLTYVCHVTPEDMENGGAGEFAMFDCEIAVKLRAMGMEDAQKRVEQLLYSKKVRQIASFKMKRGE